MGEEAGITAATLFERIWSGLAGVLGTPATAILMRRALRGALTEQTAPPSLSEMGVVREDLEYRYFLPPSWERKGGDAMAALQHLVDEHLAPLLAELAGPLGLDLLDRTPGLERHARLRGKEGGP